MYSPIYKHKLIGAVRPNIIIIFDMIKLQYIAGIIDEAFNLAI